MKNIIKFGLKQGGASGSGTVKIGIGNLASLNACLSTAKNYNQSFEGPAQPETDSHKTQEPIQEPVEKAHEPSKMSEIQKNQENPKAQQEPIKQHFPQKNQDSFKEQNQQNEPYQQQKEPYKQQNESYKQQNEPYKQQNEPYKKQYEPFKQQNEPYKPQNEFKPKTTSRPFDKSNMFNNQTNQEYKKNTYYDYDMQESPRFKAFNRDKPAKNRLFSPQPYKSNGSESRFPKQFNKSEFPRKNGLGNNVEPDISIDMRTAENTSIFDLGISETITKLLVKRKIFTLFPLQVQSFEPIKSGIDFIGKAKTGTGKTMAFVLPLLERLRELKVKRVPKILVVSPTRELANQITGEFKYYGPEFRMVCCYGGVPLNKQIELISRGLEIIVATPGRLLDLMGRKVIPLEHISSVVIDEADHMMDIGFKDDLDEILNMVNNNVKDVQVLLFSATMPQWIRNIANNYLKPNKLFIDAVGNENQTADKIKHYAIPCTDEDLEKTLELVISYYANKGKALIFTDTKSHVAQLTSRMENGINRVGCLHGDMSQYNRDQMINSFKTGEINVLIATDVAARGLDISNVELVFQVRPPQNISNYIHRSGRTGRVGKVGISVLMFNPLEDNDILMEIEKKATIEFERRGVPTQDEFIELRNQLKQELKESRLADKESLLNGRFQPQEVNVPNYQLEDSLAKVSLPQYFVPRSLLTGNSRKCTFLITSQSNRKKYELKALIEKSLEGIHLHTMAFTIKDNAIMVDIWDEQRKEVLQRLEKQSELIGTMPIFIPEHRFFSNENEEGHSLNHGNHGHGKGYGKSNHGYNQKFHKTNSTSSQMNNIGKKPYTAFNFFMRKKESD